MVDRYQILALSGGGYRGLFSAQFLASCETYFNCKLHKRFDLISGTSIGALLAAGVVCEISAQDLSEAMEIHGPKIFKRNFATGFKKYLTAPYSTDKLRDAIKDTLGDKAQLSMSDIDQPLAITAVNYTQGKAHVFRSKGLAGSYASDATLEESILASAAAPTYFPIMKIGNTEYVDGGLIANAPDMVAILDAVGLRNAELSEIYQLSIGTCAPSVAVAAHTAKVLRGPGRISWITARRLVQTTIAAQESLALEQTKKLLGSRYLRIDQAPAIGQAKMLSELDRTSKSATNTLKALAEDSWKNWQSDANLRRFLHRKAES